MNKLDKARLGVKNPRGTAHYIQDRYLSKVTTPISLTLSSRYDIGKNLFDLDWDLLIILDTCRVDVLKQVASEYSFIDERSISSLRSVGGSTLEWTANTFTNNYISKVSDTALVSNNPWPWKILEEGYTVEEKTDSQWIPTNWDTVEPGTLGKHVPAWRYGKRDLSGRKQSGSSVVTDLAIDINRNEDFDRVIAHYIEPHEPYTKIARQEGRSKMTPSEEEPWVYLMKGGDRDQVWKNYITELKSALDDIEVLLENFDAENVVISADHGEAMGEWGFYGHSTGTFHPYVRNVPVLKTTGSDKNTHEPKVDYSEENSNIEDRLEHLGYK